MFRIVCSEYLSTPERAPSPPPHQGCSGAARRITLANSATATGWAPWRTTAGTTCPAASCSSSWPSVRTGPAWSTGARTTCPGPSTRTPPGTCSVYPATPVISPGTARGSAPVATGRPVCPSSSRPPSPLPLPPPVQKKNRREVRLR